MEAILHGVMLAFGLILPLGVQNLFVLCQGALQPSFVFALPGVVTAGLCDTLLIIIAVAGAAKLLAASLAAATFMAAAGCLLLLYWGWRSWRSENGAAAEMKALTPLRQIAVTTGVSLGNPHAILDTIGVIGVSSLQYTGREKILFAMACIAVSWLWFLALALAGRIFGRRFLSGGKILNRVAAVCIWLAALCLGWRLI